MPLYPDFAAFAEHAADATLVPVSREILFDTETAVTAYHKLARPPFGFLLESVVGGEQWARYTYFGTEPRAAWRLVGDRIDRWAPEEGWTEGATSADPLGELEALLASHTPAAVPGLPRFWGGAVGFLGYDVARHLHEVRSAPPAGGGALPVPEAVLMQTGAVVAVDNLFGTARVIVPVETAGADEAELRRRYDAAGAEIDALLARLRTAAPPAPLVLSALPAEDPAVESSMTRADFEAGVRRAQAYIAAGEVEQVVLSQRLTMPLAAAPFDVYRALRALNPSPYLFYLELDGVQLVGSSPEVMVRLEDGVVTVRPIAGTRVRGATPAEDAALEADLLADPKEIAEHRMLLELGRTDVGRVARAGSVRVSQEMIVERYSHVMHLVSTVEGDLGEGLGARDVLRAGFPAGTVSGAPRGRAIEIIDEIEPVRRGPYAGAVGFIAHGGRAMDLAITIRTVVAEGGRAHVQAGAGVVADSVPEREYEETRNKARALLRAVQRAGAQL
jgi:anthranilate synthase component 1